MAEDKTTRLDNEGLASAADNLNDNELDDVAGGVRWPPMNIVKIMFKCPRCGGRHINRDSTAPICPVCSIEMIPEASDTSHL